MKYRQQEECQFLQSGKTIEYRRLHIKQAFEEKTISDFLFDNFLGLVFRILKIQKFLK